MTSFPEHLDALKHARGEANAALAILNPNQKTIDDTLASAWEAIFDYYCKLKPDPAIEDLNTASGVIYKLAQSSQHLKSLEHKTREFEEQRAKFRKIANRARTALNEPPGLTPELREHLERELELLG